MLDVGSAEVRYNSEWMGAMAPADFVRLCSHYTVARLLERDDFAKRYAAGEPVAPCTNSSTPSCKATIPWP